MRSVMSEKRRKFDQEFREGAVRIVRETGKPIAQVARDLGINKGTLAHWYAQDRAEREGTSGLFRGGHRRAETATQRERPTADGARCPSAPWSCEVRAELEEERSEVLVHAVEVVVVDHSGGLHDPRVGPALAVAEIGRASCRGLLLGPADEHHTLGTREPSQVL